MTTPKFNYHLTNSFNISSKDFNPNTLPKFFRDTQWEVAESYWVDHVEKIYLPVPEFLSRELLPYPIYEIEDFSTDGEDESKEVFVFGGVEGVFPKGEIKTSYNPMVDAPNILLVFSKIGSSKDLDKDKIIEFISKYGPLRRRADWFLHEIMDTESIITLDEHPYHCYSMHAFYYYARELHLAVKLYESLISKNIAKIKSTLLSMLIELPNFVHLMHEFSMHTEDYPTKFNPSEIIYKRSIELAKAESRRFKEHVAMIEDITGITFTEEGMYYWELFYLSYLKSEHLQILIEMLIENMRDLTLLNYAGKVLAHLTESRVGPIRSNCKFVPPNNTADNKPKFQNQWSPESLLSCMWLSFHLTITGQRDKSFRLCPVCEKPIRNPRENQIYHNGCRQAHHNRIKREVIRLWKQGKPAEEIAKHMEIEIERIAKWIKKPKEG